MSGASPVASTTWWTVLEVRRARPDDAASIAAINVASWRAAYAGLVEQSVLDDLDVHSRQREWRAYLEAPNPRDRMMVVQRGLDVIGYARTSGARDDDLDPGEVAEVCGLYIDPASWRAGAGRLLMRAALTDLAARGFGAAVLWVLTGNERARRFYEHMGFVVEGRDDKPFLGAPQIRYRAPLSEAK